VALIEAVRDGTIQIIATDHAPHTPQEKARGLAHAPFGVVGLETALSIVLAELVEPGFMELAGALRTLTAAPAERLGLPVGKIQVGAPADLLLFDPDARRIVDPERFESKGRNTPFAGWEVPGRVESVLVAGHIVYAEDRFASVRPPVELLSSS